MVAQSRLRERDAESAAGSGKVDEVWRRIKTPLG